MNYFFLNSIDTYIVEEAKLVSSCLSFPSRAKPRFSFKRKKGDVEKKKLIQKKFTALVNNKQTSKFKKSELITLLFASNGVRRYTFDKVPLCPTGNPSL